MPKLALLNNNPTEGVYQIDNSTGKLKNALKDGISGYNCGSLVATNVINTYTAKNYFNDDTFFNSETFCRDNVYIDDEYHLYFNCYTRSEISGPCSYIYQDEDDEDYDLRMRAWGGFTFITHASGSDVAIARLGISGAAKSFILGPTSIMTNNNIETGYRLFIGDYAKINNYCQALYFNATSDKRAKENFHILNNGFLDIVKNMQVYGFNYKDNTDTRTIGLIAQEVQDINIDGFSLVENKNATGEDGDFMMIRESKLIYVLLCVLICKKVARYETQHILPIFYLCSANKREINIISFNGFTFAC